MDQIFKEHIEALVPSFEKLISMPPIKGDRFAHPGKAKDPLAGVYLFSEEEDHLYVGRSNNIAQRFYVHRRASSSDNSAPFAYRLACLAAKLPNRSYVADHPDTRKARMADERFKKHFREAKAKIRKMDFRYVVEEDPVRQALLEVYCAIALKTPHNLFDNH